MRTAVAIRVPYPADADAGDALQAYTDFGSGTVDTTQPLLQGPAELFARGVLRSAGLGSEVRGETVPESTLAQPRRAPGLGNEVLGETPCGETPSFQEITVQVPPAFGKHKFAMQMVDEAGNPQGAVLAEVQTWVSSEEPPELSDFAFESYDAGTDRLTFSLAKNTE